MRNFRSCLELKVNVKHGRNSSLILLAARAENRGTLPRWCAKFSDSFKHSMVHSTVINIVSVDISLKARKGSSRRERFATKSRVARASRETVDSLFVSNQGITSSSAIASFGANIGAEHSIGLIPSRTGRALAP